MIRRFPTPPLRIPIAHRLAAALAVAPLGVLAAEAVPPPGVSVGTMLQTFAGLALILGLFVGAAWIVRRLAPGGIVRRAGGALQVVDMLPLSPRERILLVEIEDTWLVVAVGPGQMRTLHTMPRGTLPAATPGGPAFGHWLQQFRKGDHAQP